MSNRRKWLIVGAPTVLVVTALAVGASASNRTERLRSGDRMAAFMGTDRSPREWQEEIRRLGERVPSCQREFEAQDSRDVKPYDEADQLRFDDRAKFEATYGYGVVQDAIDWQKKSIAASATLGTPLPSPEEIAKSGSCLADIQPEIDAATASPEIWSALGQLLSRAEQAPHYVAAVQKWAECLRQAGYAAENPEQMTVLVDDEMRQKERRRGYPGPTEDEDYVTPLDDGDLAVIQKFEVALFSADQNCRSASGLEDVRFELESDMLEVLRDQFPNFDGAYIHRSDG